jgi:hypothetical protein
MIRCDDGGCVILQLSCSLGTLATRRVLGSLNGTDVAILTIAKIEFNRDRIMVTQLGYKLPF